jgi:hypothetical protein
MRLGRTGRILAALLLVLVALEATVAPHYAPKSFFHHLPGYAALIGLGASALVILLAKVAGKPYLQRPERDDD